MMASGLLSNWLEGTGDFMMGTTQIVTMGLLVSQLAWAQNQIELGTPAMGGTGCPQGSASVVLSDAGNAISILFDRYQVEAGGATGKRVDRKSCNLAIPIHVPAGLSISLLKFDYRGFNSLPRGAKAVFSAEYFFAGSKGLPARKTFMGPETDEFLISDGVPVESMIWSPCGEDVILRSNASMTVTTNSRYQEAFASVDSEDITNRDAGMMYYIETRQCQ